MTGTVISSGDDRDVLTGLHGVDSAAAWLDGAGDSGFVQAMLVSLQRLPAVNLAYGMAGGGPCAGRSRPAAARFRGR